MSTKIEIQQLDEYKNIIQSNALSVCTSLQESQRLMKFFEILIRIDKNKKKQNGTSNK